MAEKKSDYLNPKWQKKRLEILDRDNFTCKVCDDKDNTLHVHHMYYIKDRKVWDYQNHALYTLCEECHEHVHSIKDHKYAPSFDRIIWITSMMETMKDQGISHNGYYRAIFESLTDSQGFFDHELFDNKLCISKLDIPFLDAIEVAIYNEIPWERFGEYLEYYAANGEFKTLSVIDEHNVGAK